MIEAFLIEANIKVNSSAVKTMEDFSRATGHAAKNSEALLGMLREMNKVFNTLNPKLSSFAKSMGFLVGNVRSVTDSFAFYNEQLSVTAARTSALKHQTDSLRNSMASLNTVSRAGGAGGGGGSHRGFAHGALHGMGPVGIAAASLNLPLLGGLAVGGGVISSYKTGMEYSRETALITGQNVTGMSKSDIDKYMKQTKRNPGVSGLDLLTALNDALVVTKSADNAKMLAPQLAELNYLGRVSFGSGFKFSNSQLQAAIKVSEIVSGTKDAKVLSPYIEDMFKTLISTGGRVQPTTFLAATKAMRGYAQGMDPKQFFFMAEPLYQEYGTRVGPMVAQFYQHLAAGRMTTQGMKVLQQMDLLDMSKVTLDKIGRVKTMMPGAIHGYDEARTSPFKWIDDYLEPWFKSKGITTLKDKESYTGRIFTASDLTLVNSYLQQKEKFDVSYPANLGAAGMSQQRAATNGTSPAVIEQFTKSLTDFEKALSDLTSPSINKGIEVVTSFLTTLTGIMTSLTGNQEKNAEFTKKINPGFTKDINGGNLTQWIESKFHKEPAVHVYLDGERISGGLMKVMSRGFNTQVNHGSTDTNPLYQAVPISLNGFGGGMS